MTSDHGADQRGSGFDVVLRDHRLRAKLTQEELAAPRRRSACGPCATSNAAGPPARSGPPWSCSPPRSVSPAPTGGVPGRRPRPVAPTARRHRFVQLPPAGDLIGRDGDVAELVDPATAPPPDGPRGVTLVGLAGVGKTSLALVVSHRVAAAHPGGVAGIVVTDGFTAGEILGGVAAVFGVGRADDLSARFAGTSALLLDRRGRARAGGGRRGAVAGCWTGSRHCASWPPAGIRSGCPPNASGRSRRWSPRRPRRPADAGRGRPRTRRSASVPGPPGPGPPHAGRAGRGRAAGHPGPPRSAACRWPSSWPPPAGRVLTVAEILDRYGDRVLDLSGRPGDAVVSLRDAVAASYRLLAPAEQYALRRLAMFRHRWSLALAEQMIDGGRPTAPTSCTCSTGCSSWACSASAATAPSGSGCWTWSATTPPSGPPPRAS